jgi:hypothetical protein
MAVRGPKAQALAAEVADTVTFVQLPGESRVDVARLALDFRAIRDVELALHVSVIGDTVAPFMAPPDTDPAALRAATRWLRSYLSWPDVRPRGPTEIQARAIATLMIRHGDRVASIGCGEPQGLKDRRRRRSGEHQRRVESVDGAHEGASVRGILPDECPYGIGV